MPIESNEILRAAAYGGGGMVVLKAVEVILRTFGFAKTAQSTDLSTTLKASAELREELRKDNQQLRERLAELESRVEALEQELAATRSQRDELDSENTDLKADLRILRRRAGTE